MATLLWLVLPYLALATFVLGHVWRWRYDQFGWRTFNPPLVENRLLRLGSPLVHLGVVAVIIGHLLGLLVPKGWIAAVGVTDPAYRFVSVAAGTLAGVTLLAGLVLLVAHRPSEGFGLPDLLVNPRVLPHPRLEQQKQSKRDEER